MIKLKSLKRLYNMNMIYKSIAHRQALMIEMMNKTIAYLDREVA